MSTVTWLHISDLHWRASEAYDAHIVAEALLRDLAGRTKIAPALAQIDFIFVTGDIAFASRAEEYVLAQQFFDDLRRTTGVRKGRLFVVPGNHDVDRNAISGEARDHVNKLDRRQTVNELLEQGVHRALIMQRFHRYREFINRYFARNLIFDNVNYFYAKRRKVANDRQAAVLGLNSAWASASDTDRFNLFLGERQVRAALDQTKHTDIRIALLHHPFDWYRDFDRDVCEHLLLRECDFVLHGHLHHTHLRHLQAPGTEAMVIGAGACYDTREFRNAYNLVHLDFDLGKGTIYLRMYSDQQGGFWTKDVLTYPDAPGEYSFDLPRTWNTVPLAGSTDDAASTVKERRTVIDGTTAVPRLTQQQSPDQIEAGLDKWWKRRGYSSNPFAWSNAADVEEDSVSGLFYLWHIDPKTDADLEGLGPTPTLDRTMSLTTSRLVLIFAPGGGGKTFYRRWAARQLKEAGQHAVEVCNIGQYVQTPGDVTAWDLATCIYERVCEQLSISKETAPHDHTKLILRKCDDALGRILSASQGSKRVYVFVDDTDQLFEEQPSGARQNAQALAAIVELCRSIAERGGGEPLAIRVFMPQQLRTSVRNRLLEPIRHVRIDEHAIFWGAAHCQAVVERRLDSCWEGGPGTGINHVSRLLTQDARDEFRGWLQEHEGISPGRVVEALDRLAHFAYSRRVSTTEWIGVELWEEFSKSGKCTDLCTPDAPYPGVQVSSCDQASLEHPLR